MFWALLLLALAIILHATRPKAGCLGTLVFWALLLASVAEMTRVGSP